MAVKMSNNAISFGIVTNNPEAMLEFYRDLLGFPEETRLQFSFGSGGTVYKLKCEDTILKLLAPADKVEKLAAPGLMHEATGIRYMTIWVSNLREIMQSCEDAGAKIVMPLFEPRPGVMVGIVEDPDGNVVEFAQQD